MSKNFVVYKSSAGSGKTTTLVKEYLKLTLKNPDNFKHVLAVTFTNKAANEMKSRILDGLKEISSEKINHGIYSEIMQETGLPADQFIRHAKKLLSLIIHQYDEFSVSTIDSFVHQIVRTFSSDLKLPQGFEVIIDNEDLVPFIVEDIYDKLGRDKAFTKILIRFVMSQVEDEKSYHLDKNLSEFTKKQLEEENVGDSDKITSLSPAEFLEKIEKLRKSIFDGKTELQKTARETLRLIRDSGLSPDDFKGGRSGLGAYLLKIEKWPPKLMDLLPFKAVTAAVEYDQWYTRAKDNEIKSRIDSISPQLKKYLTDINQKVRHYIVRRLVYQNIYEMALMGEIRLLFETFTERTRKVHISEFNKRIHHEIAGQPVPFIYERLGRRYRYFLIDEFQDTSVLQWNNLLPLIEESLANGHFNMLVGDAKQAIYRFRHGEVELFTHLPHLYGLDDSPENKQRENLLIQNYAQKNLSINYRSREQIVRFNNEFFEWEGKCLTGGFDQVYQDVEQQVPDKKKPGGYVSIDFIPAENSNDFLTKRTEHILKTVKSLSDIGYPQKDICILTLQNKSAASVATYLLQHGIPVITSESLLLTSSPKVRVTVAYMKLLLSRDNQLFFAEFLINLLRVFDKDANFHQIYNEAIGKTDPLDFVLKLFNLTIPPAGLLRTRSVYEIATEIIRHLTLSDKPDLFLQFFLNYIFEKEKAYNGSLPAFLELWEEKKSKQSIVIPEGLDAVQIMTVHKAKGLKFGIVISDLHEFKKKLTHRQYWEEIPLPELGNISPVLLNISEKQLTAVGKQAVFDHENAKTKLDFLNKIYVAFTRPVDALFIIGSSMNHTKDYFSGDLINYLKNKQNWKEGVLHYEWGSFPSSEKTTGPLKIEKTVLLSNNFTTPWYDFMTVAPVEEIYWETMGQSSPRIYGKLLHAILAKIKYSEEADRQAEAFRHAGLLNEKELDHIKKLLQKVFSHPELGKFYTKGILIKTETELYDADSKTFKRPDRVILNGDILTILDYKTGGRNPKTEEKYKKQMNGYGAVFKRMGYIHVNKKLVYIHEKDVEVVNV